MQIIRAMQANGHASLLIIRVRKCLSKAFPRPYLTPGQAIKRMTNG